jgi:hypothetical protein
MCSIDHAMIECQSSSFSFNMTPNAYSSIDQISIVGVIKPIEMSIALDAHLQSIEYVAIMGVIEPFKNLNGDLSHGFDRSSDNCT